MFKNDLLLRASLTGIWAILLFTFYIKHDTAALKRDLWTNNGITKTVKDTNSLAANNDSKLQIWVLEKDNDFDSSIILSEYNFVKSDQVNESKHPMIISLSKALLFSDERIRIHSSEPLTNNKWLLNFWESIGISFWLILGLFLLYFILFIFYRKMYSSLDFISEKKIFSIIINTIIITIAIIHALFIFLLGGLFLSPFGIIATAVLSTVISGDILKYYQTKKLVSSFYQTILFAISTFGAQLFYKYTVHEPNYEFALRKFLDKIYVLESMNLSWPFLMTIVSLVIGYFVITSRVDDPIVRELNNANQTS